MAGFCRPKARGVEADTADHERGPQAWTGGRCAEDDKCVERDYELAVALANVPEGPSKPQS